MLVHDPADFKVPARRLAKPIVRGQRKSTRVESARSLQGARDMKPLIFVLLAVAILLPRSASAAGIRGVDNSDYGIQFPQEVCASFSNSSGLDANCIFSNFSPNHYYGFLVEFENPVSNIEVSFLNGSVLDAGLVVCDSNDSAHACDKTPTWDLDKSVYPTDLDSFGTSTLTSTSAVFTLTGTVSGPNVQGNQVAFLFLCKGSDGNDPAPSDCDGVNISARSLTTPPPPNPVPEPASLLLCGIGTGTAALGRRLRNRQR